jgi:hypothetical protein
MTDVVVPLKLSAASALQLIREIAKDSNNIIIIRYGRRRAKQRKITRPQIEQCVRKGTIIEGPFMNMHGNWQVNLYRHAAGEEITCVVAIDWPKRVLVINTF